MTWALSTRWAPLLDEAPDLDAVRQLDPPAVALARGLPERLTPDVRQLARELSIAWLEHPWPDADVDRLDTPGRHHRRDSVRAALRTLERANSLECPRVVASVLSAGDALRYALDRLMSAAERHGVVVGLRGTAEPAELQALLADFEGAPVGWVVDLEQPVQLATAAADRVVAYVLPNADEPDLTPWRELISADPPWVFDPEPGLAPEAVHERAGALLASLAAK